MSEVDAYFWLRRGRDEPPLVVAHRGASALAPENTLASFRLAVEQGAPAVECDVHLSADGVPVVIHDDTVDRTTDGRGAVASFTAAALRRLDAGSWRGRRFAGEGVPTLEETLPVCAGRARLFVELKAGGGQPLVDAVLAVLVRAPGLEVAVITFDPEMVRLVAGRRPDLPLGFLLGARDLTRHGTAAVLETTTSLGAGFVAPDARAVTPAFITAAHAAGFPVSVWTVDDRRSMQALTVAGADAITTNRPDVALIECRR